MGKYRSDHSLYDAPLLVVFCISTFRAGGSTASIGQSSAAAAGFAVTVSDDLSPMHPFFRDVPGLLKN
jgi:hypothetical protein